MILGAICTKCNVRSEFDGANCVCPECSWTYEVETGSTLDCDGDPKEAIADIRDSIVHGQHIRLTFPHDIGVKIREATIRKTNSEASTKIFFVDIYG